MNQVSRVLVVDEDPSALLTFTANLELAGIVALPASTIADAMSAMRTAGPFDLVVTDVRVGDLRGVALLRRLRLLQPGLPVILATAFIDDVDISVLLAEGVYTVITKPFDVDDAVAIITRAAKRPFVLVADEGASGDALATGLAAFGMQARAVRSAGEALLVIGMDGVDVCVSGVGLGISDGQTLPERIRETKRDVSVIGIASAGGKDELVNRAARAGAFACLSLPVEASTVAQMIARARSTPPPR